MAKTGHKLGILAIDIVENFVQSKLGEKFVKDLRAPTDRQIAITEAMQATADLLWTKWTDKRLWNAAFNHLPKNKELVQELKEAIKAFYEHPSDTHFAEVMKTILQEHEEFTQEIIQKSIDEYIAILTREIALNDDAFREKVTALAALDSGDSLKSIAGLLANQKLPVPMPIYTQIPPHQETEDELQAALDLLKKLPIKRIPKPAPLPHGSRPPSFPPNPLFVGRADDLRHLAAWLKGASPVAIGQIAAATGMGGIGKSQLASEFAHRYGQYFAGGVFWLSFSDPDLVPSEVAACGDPDDTRPQEARVKQVLSDWQSPLPRLLVFDNCEDAHLLTHWRLPSGGSRVLVTSRQAAWDPALGVQALPLGVLPRPESIALLRGFRPDLAADDPALNAIAAELGDLPLALHMAGSFLNTYHHDISPHQYFDILRQPGLLKHRSMMEGEFSPTGHDLNVERTFKVGLQRLNQKKKSDRLALELLRRVACFAPGDLIPRELLKDSAGEAVDAAAFADGLNRLLCLGLVEQNDAGDVRMHRLVACFVQDTFPEQATLADVEKAVDNAAIDANNSGYPVRMLPLLSHLKHITDQALKREDQQAARLANALGYYLDMIADYASAQPYYERALAINKKILGDENSTTATSLNNLAELLREIGDYAGARPYFEQALLIKRKILGEEHPATATSLNNLGALLVDMGNYAGARPYYEQALAINRKVLGKVHPATATSLNNLGGLLFRKGDYSGARQYYEQALVIDRKALGAKHPNSASDLNNLGMLLKAMGNYVGARQYYEQALVIDRIALGEHHPATATTLNNLGILLKTMGDYAAARPYYEQALAIRRKVLGEQHPTTATSLNNLGALLRAMGDNANARQYYEQALAIFEKALGTDHPTTRRVRENLDGLKQEPEGKEK